MEAIGSLESDKGALLLTNMGAVQVRRGDAVTALATFEEATRIRCLTATLHTPDGAFLLDNIAEAEAQFPDQWEDALAHFIEARGIRDSLGTQFSADGALSMAWRGKLLQRRSDRIEEALGSFQEAYKIRQALGTLDTPEGIELSQDLANCREACAKCAGPSLVSL